MVTETLTGSLVYWESLSGTRMMTTVSYTHLPCWTMASVRVSMEEVASSRIMTGGSATAVSYTHLDVYKRQVQVTILEMAEHVLAPLDYDMACEVHAYLRSKGVELMRRTTVTGFSRQGDRLFVSLQDARPLPADLVILATGVTPETTLAKEAGLELGLRGAIVVDEHMRTSNEDIYAVGDAVQVRHFVSGAPVLLPLAGPANKQGRIAADNICAVSYTHLDVYKRQMSHRP